MSGYRVGLVILFVLLALGFARNAFIVWHQPLAGFGNNNDFLRTQSCFNIGPVGVQTVRGGQHITMPATTYEYGVTYPMDYCYIGSGLALFAAAIGIDQLENALTGDTYLQLRYVGSLLLVGTAFLAAIYCTLWWRQGRRGAAVLNAAVYAVVLCDPFNTLYHNTLYLEGIALYYGYAALLATFYAMGHPTPRRIHWGLAMAGWLLFATVKAQYMLHGALAVILLLLWCRIQRCTLPRSIWLLALVVMFVPFALQQWSMQRSDFMRMFKPTNLTNLYLDTVLGAAKDPHAMAERLGLPRTCGDHAGKNIFHPDMIGGHLCPEVTELSRRHLYKVILAEPLLLLRTLPEAAARSRDWLCLRFGTLHGQEHARPDFTSLPWFSLGALTAAAPFWLLALWMIGELLLLMVVSLKAAIHTLDTQSAAFPLRHSALLWIGAAGHLVFVVSLLGDGYSDIARHNHLYQNMLAVLLFFRLSFPLYWAKTRDYFDIFDKR